MIGGENFAPELVAAIVRSADAAAAASAAMVGSGDKNAIDEAAVAAMRAVLLRAPFAGTVVIGEGEKDDAPMLANGEQLGLGFDRSLSPEERASYPACDIAVDPLDGTRLAAEALPGAVCVIALAPRGTLFDPRDAFYMHKLIAGPAGVGVLDLRLSASENLRRLADAGGRRVADLTVAVLDKPRHAALIAELRTAGARLHVVGEGDIGTAIAAATPGSGIDVAMGIGGTPEGVIAACAVRALGGFMQGRLAPQGDAERAAVLAAGHSLERVLGLDELVASEHVLFASAPVT
ncbi:D-fructose 1,6-bisphosphatase /sedoheptulose 1,7-bisphosphatase [Microterricola gilva]|uniref:Fructose-1,6-bisphosphatase class 2 n=1 Tax=Microterricola gilva TaxID=393267 RepID=A0A4Q8AN47_9MICO|nr:D-fructose 1,6-bisphosphatase /sedoheptulose 1,7-bisphosphatase [Microterricola gilva]